MSQRLTRGTALFAVVLLLGALGSPVAASEGPEARAGWWVAVGAWVHQALESIGFQPIFEESACGIDPDGRPKPCPGSTTVQGDSACSIDPNGQPRCLGV
ncbi:MAG TPA: hypothetical protein VE078_09230 [Thermoanaerobaculia bacterium]|nr:hypothetical protein [Thermoanaerobaculia bacterium]